MKEDTHLSRINLLWEQFAEAAHQKGIDVLTPPTHSNISTDVDEIGNDRIYGKEYNKNDKHFATTLQMYLPRKRQQPTGIRATM